MAQKLISAQVLSNVIKLCQAHGIANPCHSSLPSSTSYSYGVFGARIRQNFTKEWWHITLREGSVYPVHSTQQTRTDFRQKGQDIIQCGQWLESAHYLSTLNTVSRSLPFGLACQETTDSASQDLMRCHLEGDRAQEASQSENGTEKFLYSSAEQDFFHLHYYTPPSESDSRLDQWQQERLRWWKNLSSNPSRFSLQESSSDSPSGVRHITRIQFPFPWGLDTVELIQNLGSDRIQELQELSGVSHQGRWRSRVLFPEILTLQTSVERGVLALLLDAYCEDLTTTKTNAKLQLCPQISPYEVAFVTSPATMGSKMAAIEALATEVRQHDISVFYVADDSDIQTQIERFDQVGIPWCILVDRERLKTGEVYLRNRDTNLSEPVSISNLLSKMKKYLPR